MPTTDEGLIEILVSSDLSTITDVITIMREFEDILPDNDGLKWFNFLYLRVTESIRDSPPISGFEDPEWLERLDVAFANLYFRAVEDFIRGQRRVARAWEPLLNTRGRRNLARIQFALAGMNAHINRDLPLALVQIGEERQVPPRRGAPQHRDFDRINGTLENVEEQVKPVLLSGIIEELEVDLGRIDDIIALWSVRKARETAWINSELLWQVRDIPLLNDNFLLSLDRLVNLSSQGLLVPLASR